MGDGLCIYCRKNVAGPFKMISFAYRGLSVKISKNGLECPECAERSWIMNFNACGAEGLIMPGDERLEVNWSVEGSMPGERKR